MTPPTDLGQQVGLVALLSGLVGAVITAFLNYMVRLLVAARLETRKQQRLAYVHLVRLSEILAIELVAKNFVLSLGKVLSSLMEAFKKEHPDHDISHRVCVEIAKAIQELEPDKKKEMARFGPFGKRFFQHMLSNLERFQLSAEQLAQLPAESAVGYQKFSYLLDGLRTGLFMWTDAIETGDFRLMTAEMLYSQWLSLASFAASANELWRALAKHAGMSSAEASKLVAAHAALISQMSWASQTSKEKIKAAIEATERERKSKATSASGVTQTPPANSTPTGQSS